MYDGRLSGITLIELCFFRWIQSLLQSDQKISETECRREGMMLRRKGVEVSFTLIFAQAYRTFAFWDPHMTLWKLSKSSAWSVDSGLTWFCQMRWGPRS
jgi:hypothetical protein